jgi:hypothetical protein
VSSAAARPDATPGVASGSDRGENRSASTAPGTIVKRPGGVPKRPTTSSRNEADPMSRAPAWSRTVRIARSCVGQQEPTQCPSPPWMETTHGTPSVRAAAIAARPVG